MAPSKRADSAGRLPLFDAERSRQIMDDLHFKVERLIHEETCATPPRKGRTARESSSVQIGSELFDHEGNLIFG